MITLRTRLPALIAAVLATGIAPALADGHQSPTRRALLIAIDDYANVTDLRGTVNDVERVRSVLSSRFDFPDANIRTLTNRDATRDGILEAIRDHLIEPSAPGDIVVLHYSGHGSQMRDVNGDEIDGWDETLVPHDSRAAGIFDISDDELNALLAELGRKTDNITVIFDSCHSGSATRAAAGRRVERDEREPPGAPASRGGDASAEMRPPGANYVLISGARSNELANETTIDGKTFGAMSFALTEALLAGGGTMTYRDLMDEVGIRVSSEYRLQHPQLEGSGLDTLVFGVATRATEAYVLVNPDGGGKVEVSGGSLLGLARNDVLRVFAPRTSDFAGGEPVATVRLDRVGALTSRGSIESGGPVAAASRATLAGAVVGDSTLRVWIDDSSDRDTARALRRELRAAGSIEFVDENAADVWVAPAEGGLAVHGRDGTVLSPPVMPGSGDAAPRLADQLFGWARWYALLRLDNPNPGVTVDFSLHRPGDPAGAPAPASITDGSVLEYRVTNTSRKDLYIATLNLSSDGSVGVLYPPPGAQEPLPPGRTDVQQIRFRVPDERRSVVDVLKVIATDKPLNAAVLQQSAVRGEPRELPDDPLSQLIAAAVLGQTRAAANVTVSLDDWAVAARSVEIERSDARTVGFALHVDDTLTVTRSLCGGPDAPPNCVPAEPLPGDASILQSPVSGTRGVDDAFSPGAAFEAAYELRDRTGADRVEPLFEFEMPAAEPAPAGTRSGGHSETHDPAAAANDFWSLDYVRAPRAWARVRGATGKTEGNEAAGIVVAHPDTGYRHHPEVWTEIDGRRPILHEHGIDYVDGDGDAFDPLIRDARLDNPGHGTASGSVIVSPAGCQLDDTEKCVNGIGRGAQLIPLRVNTSVVVVNQKKLARAILDTADGRLGREAQMMSIAMGGPPSWTLHKAVKKAEANGVLIISAAGNYVKTVVWPARFRSTIAVGAVNIRCKPWTASSRGRAVDISAPGESVWRATVDAETETDANGMGKGTTFATGTTAGIAALWLAYHANDPRLAALKADGRLTAAFREGLRRAAWLPQDDSPIEPDDTLCADDAHLDPRRNGAGIINADALLAVDLDDLVTAGTRSADADELPITASIYPPGTPIQRVEEDYRRLFAVAGDEKLETVAYLEAELGYHYADSERVREAFDAIAIDGVRSETAFGRLREALRTSDLSPRFRRALQD